MLGVLIEAHAAGRLQFFGHHQHLADRRAFKAYLAPLWKTDWFVYAKRPFAGPEQVLAYLSRYTHRVAISNSRLISADATGVTFTYWTRPSSSAASSCMSCPRGFTASGTTACSQMAASLGPRSSPALAS
jgi:hypothetical protein